MRVESVFIADIRVGARRREEFGDIEGLAESINRFGLFHPIIVDGEGNLVAGERRLRACRDVLGWTEIPARLYADLSEAERIEIELEENTKRKDLTPFEASKELTRKAEAVAPLISTAAVEIKNERNPKGAGRKSTYEVPKKDVAQALGVSPSAVVRAEQHVEAVTKYPELSVVPTQTAAIKAAKDLDALPPSKRDEVLSKLATDGKAALAEIPRKTPTPSKAPAKAKPAGKHATNLSQIRAFILTLQSQGAEDLTAGWTEKEVFQFLDNLRECRDGMTAVISDIDNHVRELQRQAS